MAQSASQRTMAERRSKGDVIVVTGAAGGIGSAVVERIVHDGWRVVATDIDLVTIGTSLAHLPHQKGILSYSMNVSERSSVASVADTLSASSIAVAGLVNVAGLFQDSYDFMTPLNDEHRAMWEVNYFGTLHCMQLFGKAIIDGGGGSIVNTSSINEQRPLPLYTYATTKVAIGAITKLAAGALGPQGVRVNALAPGFTLTPMLKSKFEAGTRDPASALAHTAMGRMVEPSEIASVASFLLSDDASAISGVSIPVDAGWLTTSHWMNYQR